MSMGFKKHLNVSVDQELVAEAKRRGINISEELEVALARKINNSVELDETDYPDEMATIDPETYWINAKGECRKRGTNTYFLSNNGVTTETDKKSYLKWLGYFMKPQFNKESENENVSDMDLGDNEHSNQGS